MEDEIYTYTAVEPHIVKETRTGRPKASQAKGGGLGVSSRRTAVLPPEIWGDCYRTHVIQQENDVPLEREAPPQFFVRDIPH